MYSPFSRLIISQKAHTVNSKRKIIQKIAKTCKTPLEKPAKMCYTAYIADFSRIENCDTDTEDMVFGGTEEEVVERGTYWCTDIACVACIMFQIAGFPSHVLTTANTK